VRSFPHQYVNIETIKLWFLLQADRAGAELDKFIITFHCFEKLLTSAAEKVYHFQVLMAEL